MLLKLDFRGKSTFQTETGEALATTIGRQPTGWKKKADLDTAAHRW
jgi:hypothetical protein